MEAPLRTWRALIEMIAFVGAVWYSVLFLLGVGTLRPEFLDDVAGVIGFFDDYTSVFVGSWLMAVSIVGLVWFLGSLAGELRGAGEARLGAIAMGGGLIGAASVVIGSMLFSVASLRLEDVDNVVGASGVSADYLLGLHDTAMILNFAAAPFGFGIVVLAAAAAGARTRRDPRWLTILSVLLALALWFPPISWIALWVWFAWVLVTAWRLSRPDPAAAQAEVGTRSDHAA